MAQEHLAEVVGECGVIRVGGMQTDLDIFRKPHNLEFADFGLSWEESSPVANHAYRVMHPIDLIVTKLNTSRERDQNDNVFLESKIRADYRLGLARCDVEQARKMFARYADHETCAAALTNPDPAVQALALETLQEFAADGNPFAREILAHR